ncbi:HTH domain-containing protein [Microbacterium sp. 1P10UB]|uniref:helix-turn-helix transcriptional regulator n=1 Tax=unclassified Microbacterium TaxID=2609290 RepID=UPI0039A25DDC
MKRAERQYALVDLLRGARTPWSAARLAHHFEVSARTIERDVASLQLSGVPIYADHGASGGYSILREYSLPPLNLSASESLAVLAGLGLLESSPYHSAALRAAAKIAAVMPDEHRDAVMQSLRMIRVIDAVAETGTSAVPLALLSDAIAARRVVRLTYLSEETDVDSATRTSTVRDVETMGLLRAGDAWVLAGLCRLPNAMRGFRIERITAFEILDEVPPPRDSTVWDDDLSRWQTRRLG